ncbi:MAG: mechanosensitive ion channel [Hespellia sp.]|nr:mechanosensitive ion channel [Hespellia sp.]
MRVQKKKRIQRLIYDALLAVISLILLFVLLMSVQTYFALQNQHDNSIGKLSVAEQRLVTNQEDAEDVLDKYDAFSQAKLDTIAYYYQFNKDETMDAAELRNMANQWELDELYVTDQNFQIQNTFNGREIRFDSDDSLGEGIKAGTAVTEGDLRYYVSQIDSENYLIGARNISMMQYTMSDMTSLPYSLKTIKIGQKGYIIAVNVKDQTIAYHPDADLIGQSLKDADFDSSVMSDGYEGWAELGGEKFYCNSQISEACPEYELIAVRPQKMIWDSIIQLVNIGMLVFALIIAIMILYIHFIREEHSTFDPESQSEMQYIRFRGKYYLNQTMGARIVHILTLGVLILFGASFYLQSLSVLSTQFAHFSDKKTDIMAIFDENEAKLKKLTAEYNTEYEQRAYNIAYLLAKDPTLMDDEKLDQFAKRAQLKYIYVFNGDGLAIAGNGIDKQFVLSTDAESQSYQFWNVVKGHQESLIQEAQSDDSSKADYLQYIGVRRPDAEGMVQIAVSPQRLENRLKAVQTNHVLKLIAVENNGFCMAVDSETKKVVYYPDSNYIGTSATKLGLSERALSDNYTGYQTLAGVQCAVRSMQYQDDYIYIVAPRASITQGRLAISLIITLAGFIVLLLITFFSIIGDPEKISKQSLTEEENDANKEPKKEPKSSFEIVTGSGEVIQADPIHERWRAKAEWKSMNAEQKLRKVISVTIAGLGILLLLYMMLGMRSYDNTSVLSYIVHKKWEKVPNIFSFTYIAMIMLETVVVSSIVIKLISMLVTNLGAKAETVAKLTCNFIKYISIIGAIFYCLTFIGINGKTLLTSAGLMSLVVGLGAQSLISDILAGIFIVFEGEFRVGDIITLGTFRGTVLEIGIRSTKIEDFSQDIKIVNNSDITGIVNMTRKYSYAFCDVGIEYTESLERVETILQKELPHVKERLPEIEAGPYYRGVISLGDSSVVIRILAQCQEVHRVPLTRDLNREIKLIFDRNNISIPFPQVVVNEPQKRSSTISQHDKIAASEFVAEQKEITKDIRPQ